MYKASLGRPRPAFACLGLAVACTQRGWGPLYKDPRVAGTRRPWEGNLTSQPLYSTKAGEAPPSKGVVILNHLPPPVGGGIQQHRGATQGGTVGFATKFCAECRGRELPSSHGDYFREHFRFLHFLLSKSTKIDQTKQRVGGPWPVPVARARARVNKRVRALVTQGCMRIKSSSRTGHNDRHFEIHT